MGKHLDSWAKRLEEGDFRQWERRARQKQRAWISAIAFSKAIKRLLDIAGGAMGLILFSPIFLATAILIKLEDGGPIFFKQTRIGAFGKPFKIWKFRSMVINADQIKDQILESNQHGKDGVTFKMKDDPRITKVGKWIRKLSIDEFPQFYNVLIGDMSIVGPRPPVPKEVAMYKAFHLRRLRVKPGITCTWQVGGRADIQFEDQVRLDIAYSQSQSFKQDVILILKTVPAVIFGNGAY